MLYGQEFFIVYHECQNRLYLELKYVIAPRLRFVSIENFSYKRSTQKVITLSIVSHYHQF